MEPNARAWRFAFDQQMTQLDAGHTPRLMFKPGDSFLAWRDRLRTALTDLLGPLPTPVDPEPVVFGGKSRQIFVDLATLILILF